MYFLLIHGNAIPQNDLPEKLNYWLVEKTFFLTWHIVLAFEISHEQDVHDAQVPLHS